MGMVGQMIKKVGPMLMQEAGSTGPSGPFSFTTDTGPDIVMKEKQPSPNHEPLRPLDPTSEVAIVQKVDQV